MGLQRTDVAHFTSEQVEGHVRDALEVAGNCGLTDEERVALLPAILDKLASKQVVLEQVPDVPLLGQLNGRG